MSYGELTGEWFAKGPACKPGIYTYTVYPSWFGGQVEATNGVMGLARDTASRHGWVVAGVTMTPDGHDSRGERMIATVDYRSARLNA